MDKTIEVMLKGCPKATWDKGEWDDYAFSDNLFIVKKYKEWVGVYNMESVISVTVR